MLKFDSYEQLHQYLRGWTNILGGPEYDFAGALTLALALLDNLRQHRLDAELEDLSDGLTAEQAAFIVRLATHLAPHGSTT